MNVGNRRKYVIDNTETDEFKNIYGRFLINDNDFTKFSNNDFIIENNTENSFFSFETEVQNFISINYCLFFFYFLIFTYQ